MTGPDGAALDGLQQIVDRLAAALQRSVAIDDTQGRLVASSGHFGEEDELRVWAIVHRYSDPRVLAHFAAAGIYSWREPGRIPENPQLQFKARVCCPIRDHDILFGHLFLIDEGVSDDEIDQARAACAQIGQLMYRRLALHEEAAKQAEVLAREFVSPDRETRQRAARAAQDDRVLTVIDPARAVIVRVLDAAGGSVETDLHTAVEQTTRARLSGASLGWVRTDEAVVLVFGRASAKGVEIAEQLVSRLHGLGHRAVAGVGPTGSDLRAAARSFAEATLAVQGASLLPRLGSVVTTDALGLYRLLLQLPPDELNPTRYPMPLQRIIAADSADALLETLATYLDCAGDVGRTAAALRVHRSTLYYRLGRIEAISGAELRDGSQRLLLHLGLRLRDLVEAL